MNLTSKSLATVATAAALALPSQAQAQWARVGMSIGTKYETIARIEGGAGSINYAFLDVINDGTNRYHFGQVQLTKPLGSTAIKPTIGLEIQLTNHPFIAEHEVVRPQVGANAEWKGGFGGLRIAPQIRQLGLARDNEIQVSLSGQHTFENILDTKHNVTIGFWRDANINRGEKPFPVGEAYLAINPSVKLFGTPVEVMVYRGTNVSGDGVVWRAGLRTK